MRKQGAARAASPSRLEDIVNEHSRIDATRILLEIRSGDEQKEACGLLFAALYDELRLLAQGLMRRERRDHTLRPTALVNEAYVRLIDKSQVSWENRAHFFGIAARAMRQILVDHARQRAARKRGGGLTRITLDEDVRPEGVQETELLNLHEALERLARHNERIARVVELRTFGGLTAKEAAHVLGISKRTADGDWSFARLWLSRELRGDAA
jgi:RNA polymerase sigma factor (TIGR02999 family)